MNIKPYLLFIFIIIALPCVSVAGESAQCEEQQKALAKRYEVNQKALAKSYEVNQKALAKSYEVNQKALAKSYEVNQKALAKSYEVNQKALAKSYEVNQKALAKRCVKIFEFSEQINQVVTSCGSNQWWQWQRISLQVLVEVPQATLARYSFNVACQNHDACYSDCRTDKSECDNKLLVDAEKVCESALMKDSCNSSARIFYMFVSGMGDSFFNKARANCSKM